jgi:hypothetical protein
MPTEPSNSADNGGSRQIVLASTPVDPADPAAAPATAGPPPDRQLAELPKDVLENLAEELGIDPTRSKTRQHLVLAVHERRQLIASLDRDALLDVIRWGRRPITTNASKEQLAREIVRIRSMRFAGLSHRGLSALVRLRGLEAQDQDPVPLLVRKLRKQEGFFSRLNRRRRAVLGSIVAGIVGESDANRDYHFLPDPAAPDASAEPASIKDEIESSGLFGGITNRIKRSADQYLNQKLDEIEARIDRKLDQIDRRLGEWRDKEIANRIRILKITLWASVIVGVFSLVYAYVSQYLWPH